MGTTKYIIGQELYHHGIKGQKWGVRRYQNSDGSLTASGRKRYGRGDRYSEELRGNLAKHQTKSEARTVKISDKTKNKLAKHEKSSEKKRLKIEKKADKQLSKESTKQLRYRQLEGQLSMAEKISASQSRVKKFLQGGTAGNMFVAGYMSGKGMTQKQAERANIGRQVATGLTMGAFGAVAIGSLLKN